MTVTLPQQTSASRRAEANFRCNLRALRQMQPALAAALQALDHDVEWLFGRDGALSARDACGRWVAGCSVPQRAAREMLQKLDLAGAVGCFLSPPHAAHVAVALERMRPEQALVVLLPQLDDLRMMLHCENVVRAIGAHRLWFAAGPEWAGQLKELYDEQIGLATPGQFIRVAASGDERIQSLIDTAQQVIAQISTSRAAAAEELGARPWCGPAVTRLCVVAPTRFRLWNDVGNELIAAAEEACAGDDLAWTLYDADDPACSAPLGLARTARQCSAILTANTARCDLPGLLPGQMPWITWVSGGRIPRACADGPHDQLLLADPAAAPMALKSGWRESQVHVATWRPPGAGAAGAAPAGAAAAEPALTVIADTSALDVPEDLDEYSSHTLLWNGMRDELMSNPFAPGEDVQGYLASRMRALEIAEQGFPQQAFIHRLILPAVQQGLAAALLDAGFRMELYGQGWGEMARFAGHARGPVESREHLREILRGSQALVHVWPGRRGHPVEHAGLPLVRATPQGPAELVASARRALRATSCQAASSAAPLGGAMLRRLLGRR